jgi:hypothetical protein
VPLMALDGTLDNEGHWLVLHDRPPCVRLLGHGRGCGTTVLLDPSRRAERVDFVRGQGA